MNNIDDERKEKILDEIIQSIKDKNVKYSYEVTVEEFAEKIGMSQSYAKRFLSDKVRKNEMTKRHIIIDGKTFVVYSMI